MTVSLTPELEKFINGKIESGKYSSASEVVREALRLLQDHDEVRARQLERLRRDIQVGLDQLDRGESYLLEDVVERLQRRSRERRQKRA